MKPIIGILAVSLLFSGCAAFAPIKGLPPLTVAEQEKIKAEDAQFARDYGMAHQAYLASTTPEQRRADQQQAALNNIAYSLDRIARNQSYQKP